MFNYSTLVPWGREWLDQLLLSVLQVKYINKLDASGREGDNTGWTEYCTTQFDDAYVMLYILHYNLVRL